MLRSLSPLRSFFDCSTTTGGLRPRLWSFAPPVLFPGHQYIRIGNQPRFPSPPRGGTRGGVCYPLNAINLSTPPPTPPLRGEGRGSVHPFPLEVGQFPVATSPSPLGRMGGGFTPPRGGERKRASLPARGGSIFCRNKHLPLGGGWEGAFPPLRRGGEYPLTLRSEAVSPTFYNSTATETAAPQHVGHSRLLSFVMLRPLAYSSGMGRNQWSLFCNQERSFGSTSPVWRFETRLAR